LVKHAIELYQRYKSEFFNQDKTDEVYLQLHEEVEAIYSPHNSCSLIGHNQENKHFDKCKASNTSVFIKNICKRVIDLIDVIMTKEKLDNTSEKGKYYSAIQNEFHLLCVDADDLEESLISELNENEVTSQCSNYQGALLDLEFSSKMLISIGEKTKEIHDKKNDGILDRMMKNVIDTIRKKINGIIQRFSGIVSHLCKFITDSLNKLENDVVTLTDKIVDTFLSLSARFLELVQNLTEEMFKFLVKFKSIAHSKGFELSKMEVKIPSVEFESLNIFGVSIPFPKIQSPEILMTVDSNK